MTLLGLQRFDRGLKLRRQTAAIAPVVQLAVVDTEPSLLRRCLEMSHYRQENNGPCLVSPHVR